MMLNRISINKKVCQGRAFIKGTEIPVHRILRMMANGDSIETVLKTLPSITSEDIQSCLAFAANLANRKIKKSKFESIRLKEAIAIVDPKARAEALYEFALSPDGQISNKAFRQIGKCGEAALPILRNLKNIPSMRNDRTILYAYGDIGGELAGEEIASLIKKELEHWQAIAPVLKAEWFNKDNGDYYARLSNRYTLLTHLLRILEKTNYSKCQETVKDVHNLWLSSHIDELAGTHLITNICNSILNPVDENSPKIVIRSGVKVRNTNKLDE